MTKTSDNATPTRPHVQLAAATDRRAVRCKSASTVLQDRQLEPARIRPNRKPSGGVFMSQVPCLGLQSGTVGAISPGSRPPAGGQSPRGARLQETVEWAVLKGTGALVPEVGS